MSELFDQVEELTGDVKSYINTRIEMAKLNTAAKVSSVTSNWVS